MAQPRKHKTTGSYYLRRKVPVELRPLLGHEFKRSLKTHDPAEAKARFAEQWALSEAAFARARAHVAGQDVWQPGDAERLADQWFVAEQARVWETGAFTDLLAHETTYTDPVTGEEQDEYTDLRSYVDSDPDTSWQSEVQAVAEVALRAQSWPMPASGSVAHGRVVAAFGERLQRLSSWALECHEGKAGAQMPVTAAAGRALSPTGPKSGLAVNGKRQTLRDLFGEYSTQKKLNDGDNRSTRKTLAEFGAGVDSFIELHGNLALHDLGRDTIAKHRAMLAQTPAKGKGIRGLTAPQLIAKAEKEGLPRLSEPTIRNRLRALSAILSCGVQLGWMAENPVIAGGAAKAAARAAARRQAGAGKRKHFTHAELSAIFASPVFSQQWSSPRADFGAAWFWLPLLLYYTGARREEVAQLAVADVQYDDAAGWFVSILEMDDSTRTVKTDGSRRQVPLHSDLLERGFITYVQSLPSSGPLFPKLQPDKKGFFGANFGKRWAAYLREVVKLDSPASPSHGFRHSFKTLCREAGIAEDVHDAITGHVGGRGVARGYGAMPLTRMAEEMRRFPVAPLPR